MFNLNVKGGKKLNRKLNNMALGAARKVVRPAIRKALVPVVQTAKALAPVDEGRMRRTIKPFSKSSRRHGVIGQVRTGTRKQLGIPDDSKYYYPAAIEYGTRYIKARPFLRTAMGKEKRRVLDILGKEIAREIIRL